MAELKVEKSWTDGGQLFVQVSCPDRDKLVDGIRGFVKSFVEKPENNLSAWAGAGVDKAECPQAYDPENPSEDPYKLSKEAAKTGRKIDWVYTQTVRLTRGI